MRRMLATRESSIDEQRYLHNASTTGQGSPGRQWVTCYVSLCIIPRFGGSPTKSAFVAGFLDGTASMIGFPSDLLR